VSTASAHVTAGLFDRTIPARPEATISFGALARGTGATSFAGRTRFSGLTSGKRANTLLSSYKVLCIDSISDGVMTKSRADFLQGTLDLLILKALTLGSLHGWGVSKRIRQMSRDALEVNQGSLYPALHRLEDRGFVTSEWKTSDEGRQAKFYRLTKLGRKQCADEQQRWELFATAVGHTLQAGS
jgi:transcriptional regulator